MKDLKQIERSLGIFTKRLIMTIQEYKQELLDLLWQWELTQDEYDELIEWI